MSFDSRRLRELEEIVRGLQEEAVIGQSTLPTNNYLVSIPRSYSLNENDGHSQRLDALEETIKELRVGSKRRGSENRKTDRPTRIQMILTQLESLNTAIFICLATLFKAMVGLVTRTMAVGAVLLVLYVVAQPLLFASMYHESGIQTGIETIELVEEGTNTLVQVSLTFCCHSSLPNRHFSSRRMLIYICIQKVGNTAMDVVRSASTRVFCHYAINIPFVGIIPIGTAKCQ
jgi:hypothetical protein